MARASGSWNWFGYHDNAWRMVIEDKEYLHINRSGGVRISGSDYAYTGSLVVTDDINSAGGHVQSIVFCHSSTLQNTSQVMTASIVGDQSFTQVPMVRSGSIIGIALYSETCAIDDSSAGALTASVTVDGVNVACSLALSTGSAGDATIAKDTVTFNPQQRIGVSLTASADYLTDLAGSGSWIATVAYEY